MKTVYSKDNCPGCVQLLKEYDLNGFVEGIHYKVMKIGKDISLEDFSLMYPKVRSVPFVVDLDINIY